MLEAPASGAMGTLARVGLLLLLALGLHQSPGLRCEIHADDFKSKKTVVESDEFVSRWTNSAAGRHLWQVSLKLGGHNFCGGSLIQDDWIVTIVHCLGDLNEKELEVLTVIAGDYNLFQREKQEQNIPVSKVIIHPEFNSLGSMSSDIALLNLKHKAKFDYKPQVVMLFGEISRIPYPCSKENDYSHNCLCIWKIMVPEDKIILIKLTSLGRRNRIRCDYCSIFLQSRNRVPVSFVCGRVTIVVENGIIHRASYPYLYLSNAWCHWFICAPKKHIIKLTFEDFNELNPNHIHDAVVIYDPKEEYELDSLNKIGLASPLKTKPLSTTKAIPYDVCGIPPFSPQWLSRRIAGGEEACPHCWPWQVGLRFLGDHQCGGAIISPVWILTAAHCVQSKGDPLSWTIVAGDHDRTLKESMEQVRRAKHIIVHEDFDTVTYDSDIALIQLSSPLEYNWAVRPVCLPHSTEPLDPSGLCVVTGWGSTSGDGGLASGLQQIQVPVLEGASCERTYYSAHPGGITDKMLCAGSAASVGKDFCQGDSGGPLVCRRDDGPFVLYGIVSWGAGCVQPWRPGVFARVRVFLNWIQSKIKVPASLQTKNKRKTLTKRLPPPIPSTDSASGPGRKGSKITGLPQSSNQEHMVTCKDVLAKPAGITQISRHSHRASMRCPWRLVASLSHIIHLRVTKFQMKPTPLACHSLLQFYKGFKPGQKLKRN